jgi:uracil-DNA glycosylase family 4
MVVIEETGYGCHVRPGSGWPGDPATPDTAVATGPAGVTALAAGATGLAGADGLDARVTVCRACDRLVRWREQVAKERRAAFADQVYWGRPGPGFGDPAARIAILGLAPAAHGANRTGRMFTGDRSGDVLYAALYRAGLANQPTSVAADDGLALRDVRIFSAVRCAPPANKPTPAERDTCLPWAARELALLRPTLRVVVALGQFAWNAFWPAARDGLGEPVPVPRPAFGHGVEHAGDTITLLGCYHVSQQNTFTGRLTPTMLDEVLARAREHAGRG